jgi:superfamily II DNA/RNA helicase
VVPT